MAHIMVNGAVGSGKSVHAQQLIDQMLMRDAKRRRADGRHEPLRSERLFSTIPLEGHDVPATVVDRKTIYTAHCGVLFIDELQLYLGARDWEKMSDDAKDFWTRHRHYDVTIISTTQHPSFVDKMCRILTDEVRLMSIVSLPFVGWFKRSSVRPPDPCRCAACQAVPHPRRDALGDRHYWWQRAFGFGTILIWRVYPPSILGGEEMLNPRDLVLAGKLPKSVGWCFFDMKWAARARASVAAARPQAAAATPPQSALL